MKIDAGEAVFSPSDLNHFLECEHLIQLELRRAGAPRAERDEHAELLAQKGLDHEAAWLQRFRDEARRIVTIGGDSAARTERDWERDAADTIAAMRDGADVIYQGVFLADGWRGISDFLVRADVAAGDRRTGPRTGPVTYDRPVDRGTGPRSGPVTFDRPVDRRTGPRSGPVTSDRPVLYEAWDTKLARSSKPYFVLQLCFYTEQIGRIQGVDPEYMHIVLGTGQTNRFRYEDFAAYYRAVRRRFIAATQSGLPTSPYPVAHCALCHHARSCEDEWYAADHPSQVAGITREQVQRLRDAGITTVADLAARDSLAGAGSRSAAGLPSVRISQATLDRLQHQARLQSHHRQTGKHVYEVLPVDERSGFRLLPQPNEGDIFFDMEGDPYFEPAAGLEYLFGAITAPQHFTFFQALNRDEEKRAFEQFIDWVHARLKQWPGLHVYHYAPYEVTALKRLMSTHATREDALDDLLRREVFVDLYQVVRQSLRISHNSYSIKKVRTFFMEAGKGAVADGGDSILQFERFRQTGDPALLQAIVDYNREDCISTLHLRDWLVARREEVARNLPWKVVEQKPDSPKRVDEDAQTAARVSALLEAAPGKSGNELLAHLLNYHRREAKPEWWAYFDRQKKGLDELLDDTQSIAWLGDVGAAPVAEKQSLVYTLGFPDQEFKLGADAKVIDPFTGESPGSLEWVDGSALRLGLKRGKKRTEPLPVAVCAGAPIDDAAQRAALGRVADVSVAAASSVVQRWSSSPYGAVLALLARERPRAGRTTLQTLDLAEQTAIVHALDGSYLFVQGPPGSGKTWTGARLIVSLIAAGKRVGVAANSHKAINNLLREVESVARDRGVAFEGLKKGSKEEDAFNGALIRDVEKNEEIEGSAVHLIAGTAWLFSREGMDRSLDYLFIDEAGQVALADAVAMSTAARNLVLLGDPQQLPQVRQGIHPAGSGVSVLEHLLTGDRPDEGDASHTVQPDRGIFLGQSWRMHPEICRFVSELSYDGRLESAPGRERQRVDSQGLAGAGLRYIPVEHTGNSQQSSQEAEAIAREVSLLLDGGTFTDHEGRTRLLEPADILVVAPYNMHVRCLRERLPAGVEVGTVDKFQGREAPVVVFSMASSTGDDVPRGIEFLFNRNRFNVAISRARALAVVVSSPRLLDARCTRVEQMPLVNMLCRYVELAT